jgi:anti-anti-sigma regulatory factor
MDVKIDTREKFHAITVPEPILAANMTAALDKCLLPLLHNDVKSVILILKDIKNIDLAAGEYLVKTQQTFYEHDASFVICGLAPAVEKSLAEQQLLELMNVAPTASEAADIVQMEEIERELLNGEDIS